MWNIGNGKNEGNESLKSFWAKWRWCLENGRMPVHLWKKLRDKTHGEGKGPLIVVYTPKEPEMIIRCSFVFIWRTFLSLPTSHCVLRMNFSIPPSCRISIHGSFLSWRVYWEWVLYLECTLELPVDQSRRQQPVNIIQFQRSDQSTGLN